MPEVFGERAGEGTPAEGGLAEQTRLLVAEYQGKSAVVGRFLTNPTGVEFPLDALQYSARLREIREKVERLTGEPLEYAINSAATDAIRIEAYSAARADASVIASAEPLAATLIESVMSRYPTLSYEDVELAWSAGVRQGVDERQTITAEELSEIEKKATQGSARSLDVTLPVILEQLRSEIDEGVRSLRSQDLTPAAAVATINHYRGTANLFNEVVSRLSAASEQIHAALPPEINIENLTEQMQAAVVTQQHGHSHSHSMSM